MKIGGFLPLSLSDYPGRTAAVVFTRGCNFRCPFCHNGHLLDADFPSTSPDIRSAQTYAVREAARSVDEAFSTASVLDEIERRRRLLDGVVISGGEPTLQPGLAEFIEHVRGLGLRIKLDTNGSRPAVLEALFESGALDFVAMDIKAPWARYNLLCGVPVDVAAVQRSMQLVAASGLAHEFRTTFVPALLSEADLDCIRAALPPGSRHRTQRFVPELSLSPALRPAAAYGSSMDSRNATSPEIDRRIVSRASR